jgi:sulfotransferase family protein
MIVLSVGMPRAGSGWHYNLIHDLMRTTGCAEASDIRRSFKLQGILTEVNCNIGVLSFRRLSAVAIPALLGNTFVIKAHSRPTSASRLMRAFGLLRITYIYRDPRDAMLSAMEYGSRGLQRGRPNAFSQLTEFDAAMDFMTGYVQIWSKWVAEPGVLVSRYEDLLGRYDQETGRLVDYLELDPKSRTLSDVLVQYRPDEAEGRQGTHFFKGRIGRFREAFTSGQQAAMAERFGPFLPKMGYPL